MARRTARSRVTLSGVITRTTRLHEGRARVEGLLPVPQREDPELHGQRREGLLPLLRLRRARRRDPLDDRPARPRPSWTRSRNWPAEAGMEVPAPDPRAAQAAEQRDTLHDVMAAAQDWFARQPRRHRKAQRARAYLATRGFDAAYLRAVRLRLCAGRPAGAEDGAGASSRGDADRGRACASRSIEQGALRPLSRPADAADRRCARPGHRLRRRASSTARKSDAPKYLNSPDTPLFDKGRTLYNLHRAGPASRQTGRLVVVEGYMDAIALAAAGIEEVVAPLGTALTERQIELLWRLVEMPVLCFDGDAAGQRAAMRAVGRALPLLRPGPFAAIVTAARRHRPRRSGQARRPRPALEAAARRRRSRCSTRCGSTSATPPRCHARRTRPASRHGCSTTSRPIADPDIQALYRRELLDRFSAFAFPAPREHSDPRPRQAPPAAPTQAASRRLRRSARAELRDGSGRGGAGRARSAGPRRSRRHAEALARAGHRRSANWRLCSKPLDLGRRA